MNPIQEADSAEKGLVLLLGAIIAAVIAYLIVNVEIKVEDEDEEPVL